MMPSRCTSASAASVSIGAVGTSRDLSYVSAASAMRMRCTLTCSAPRYSETLPRIFTTRPASSARAPIGPL